MGTKFATNRFYTTHLTLNVMATVARGLGLDLTDDDIADRLYDICCDLEDFPEDEGFGTSDHYGYFKHARSEFAAELKEGNAT